MFVVEIFGSDGAELVPEVQDRGDYDCDSHADREENSISRKQDEQSHYGANRNDKGGGALYRQSERGSSGHACLL